MRVKTELKRQAIIDVALQVFLEMGYQRASMGAISGRLGGSKATLYSYYDSKEELFVDVIHTSIRPLLAPAFSELTQGFDNVRATLTEFGKRLMRILCMPEFVAARRMIIAESGHTDIGEKFYNDGPKKGHEAVVAYITGAMDAKKLRVADPEITATHLQALLRAETMDRTMFFLSTPMSPNLIDESVERAIEVFMRAYGWQTAA